MGELARQFKEARTMLDDLDAAAPAPAQPQVPDAHRPRPGRRSLALDLMEELAHQAR